MVFPLKLIVVGMAFYVFDINIFGINLLNDTLGLLFITFGVIQLTFNYSSKRYDYGMTYVSIILILSIASELFQIFNPDLFQEYFQYFNYLSVFQSIAIVIFCMSMYWFCDELIIKEITKYWQSAYLLFTFCLIIPGAIVKWIVYFYNLNTLISDIIWVIILVVYVVLATIPLIHIFQVSMKMLRYAERYSPKDFSSKGTI